MTKFLASVRSVEEARIVFEGGADLIDCKDPVSGALGALPDETVAAIVRAVAGHRPVSATIGDVPMEPGLIRAAVRAKVETGVDYVKIGIFFGEPSSRPTPSEFPACIAELALLARRTSLIAVLFADERADLDLLPTFANAGWAGVMLDTEKKGGGGLMSHVSYTFLERFESRARELRLMNGLAGSLAPKDVPRLLQLSPDYLGFRTALCETGRASAVDGERVMQIANLMSAVRERSDSMV